jgi:hypothetical protein
LNAQGDILEDKTYGGSLLDQLTEAKLTSSGEIILTGISSSDISGEVSTDSYNNSSDSWTLVIDRNNLNIMSQYRYGGTESEVVPNIIEAENNTLYLFGGSKSPVSSDKTHESKGLTDFWILELSTDLRNTSFSLRESVLAYPNPATNTINFINLNSLEVYTVVIYDMMGRKKLSQTIDAQKKQD